MFTLTFDKGAKRERKIQLDSFYERPILNSFNGSLSVMVGKETPVPDIHGFYDDRSFETVEAVNGDGIEIPVSGEYNTITDCTINYDDNRKVYSVNIALGKAEPEEAAE